MLIARNGEAKLVVMGVSSYEEYEGMLAPLEVLALGNRKVERGHFWVTDDVLAELGKKDRQ